MNTTRKQPEDSWEKFLNPEILQANLIAASLFITAYEMLKDCIIHELRSFWCFDLDEHDGNFGESYEQEVLALDPKKNVFRASVARLKADSVIDSHDVDVIFELRRHRNELAHQLPKFLAESSHNIELTRLAQIVALVRKIDRWWIINFELAIRNDIDPEQVDQNRITSGRMIFLQMLLQTASAGKTSDLYREFLAVRGKLTKADQ